MAQTNFVGVQVPEDCRDRLFEFKEAQRLSFGAAVDMLLEFWAEHQPEAETDNAQLEPVAVKVSMRRRLAGWTRRNRV